MSNIVKLPVRSADPDAPISLRTWAQRGGSPVISLEAVLRWSPGFDPHAAAASCLLAASYEAAVDFWLGHVAALRRAMHAMGLDAGTTENIVSEYTAATRREVRVLRTANMPREAWVAESFSTFDAAVHL